jgi:hypothetical protein
MKEHKGRLRVLKGMLQTRDGESNRRMEKITY